MEDLLQVQSSERVDLEDFVFAADESPQKQQRQLMDQFVIPSTGYRILSGFAISNPSGKQLQVTKGRAILGQREGGVAYSAVLTSAGDTTKIVDMAAFASATYGIYIRFVFADAEQEGRAFWDPSAGASGEEYAQTVYTRRAANWSLRVETSSPGSEWLKIGEVVQSSMAITDQREFYFEGNPDDTTAYQSGWSSDGGGIANDRNTDRATYGVTDLQTFTAAVRQCLEDLKGRGLKKWYSRDIGGMNVGFDADPVSGRLAVGDADFYFETPSSTTAKIGFDAAADNNYLEFLRDTSDRWRWVRQGIVHHEIDGDGFNAGTGGHVSFKFRRETAQTTTPATVMQVKHETSGNIASGFGSQLDFLVEDSGVSDQLAGRIATSRRADDYDHWLSLWTVNTDVAYEALRLNEDGFCSMRRSLYVGDITGADPGDNNIEAANNVIAANAFQVTGSGPEVTKLVDQASAQAPSSDTISTTGTFATTYSIPANSLRDGSVIRVRAAIANNGTSISGALVMNLRFNATDVAGVFTTGFLGGTPDPVGIITWEAVVDDQGGGNYDLAHAGYIVEPITGYDEARPSGGRITALSFSSSYTIDVEISTNADAQTFQLISLVVDVAA